MTFARRTLLTLSIAAGGGAVASCEETGDDSLDETRAHEHGSLPQAGAARARARSTVELPGIEMRRWFHPVGDAIVGGGARYDIRATAGAVRFTPGAADGWGRPIAGPALTLQTRRVGRGGATLSAFTEQRAAAGRLHIEHGEATEVWVNGVEAAEQAFHFPERPKGDGDLFVEISTSGLDCVATTAAGLRFALEEGGAGVSYGHGVFIDARGHTTEVAASCDEGGITLRVPEAVVEDAQFPAVLDPVVGPISELTDPVSASGNGERLAVACSDATCLMAFVDDRDGVVRRYVGRFTPQGVLLDDLPVVVGLPPAPSEEISRVAFVQDRFLIVYKQGATGYGQFIGEDGSIIGTPFNVASAVNGNLELACGATDCLVSWMENPLSLARLRANQIALDGTVTSPTGFTVANSAQLARPIQWAQGRYFVTYRPSSSAADDGMNVVRVENGVVLDATPITLFAVTFDDLPPVGVATNGSSIFATARKVPSSQTRRRGTFLSTDGAILPPGPEFIMPSPDIGTSTNFGFAWNGSSYSSIYLAGNLFTYVTSADGSTVAPPVVVAPSVSGEATLAPLPSGGAVIAYRDGGLLVRTSYGRRLDSTGQLTGAAFPIAFGHNIQRSTSVARGVGQYLVAWFDRRLDTHYVVAARVGPDGAVLDPTGIVLAELGHSVNQTKLAVAGPDVVWNGSSYLVVWSDQSFTGGGVFAKRVSASGNVMDASPTLVRDGEEFFNPSAAWSGVVHMVAYQSSGNNVVSSRLTAAGAPIDFVFHGFSSSTRPQIAWTGSEFLIMTSAGYVSVTAAGVVQQPGVVPLPSAPTVKSMACNGASCSLLAGYGASLRSAPFDAVTKTVGPTTTIQPSGAPAVRGDVVWDGARFLTVYGAGDLVAWTQGATPATVEVGFASTDAASLASLGDGESLLAFVQDGAGTLGTIPRVYATIIDGAGDLGVPCLVAADCESGFCVEGVCCDTLCGGGDPADCQACSTATGAATTGVCGPIAANTVCRGATGVCDQVEMCDGVSGLCPVDELLAGVDCRASTGSCDPAEQCSGLSIGCPADAFAVSGTVCRSAAGVCDVAETCNGVSAGCPPDAAVIPGTPCVGQPNGCVSEACEGLIGATATCAQSALSAGTMCRPSAGPCDIGETCDGTDAPCPADAYLAAGEICRPAAGVCDVEEVCSGAAASCPVDAKSVSGVECRGATGECDLAEFCDGAANACPTNIGVAAGTACGPSPVGACELQATCSGDGSMTCQPNFAPAGTTCRAAAGECDAAELCDGASGACPDDALRAAGEVCNTKDAANDCDIDDLCDGITLGCVPVVAADGTVCEVGLEPGACSEGECELSPGTGGGASGGSGSGGEPSGGSGSGGEPSGSGGSGGSASGGDPTSSTTGSGAGGVGSTGEPDAPASDADGCSCTTAPEKNTRSAGGLGLVLALVLTTRRRSRRRIGG